MGHLGGSVGDQEANIYFKNRRRNEDFQLLGSSSQGNQWPHPFDDLL